MESLSYNFSLGKNLFDNVCDILGISLKYKKFAKQRNVRMYMNFENPFSINY